MKVDFASDNKNGNNLKKDEVLYRDRSEIVKPSTSQQNSSSVPLTAENLTVQNSSLEEMFENLSEEQEELLLVAMRDVSKHLHETGHKGESRGLIEALANDENMLKCMTKVLTKVQNRGRHTYSY